MQELSFTGPITVIELECTKDEILRREPLKMMLQISKTNYLPLTTE